MKIEKKTLILISLTISLIGDWVYKLVLPIIVFEKTNSAYITSLMYIIEFLPYIIFGLFSGAITDKRKKKEMILKTNFYSAVILIFLAFIIKIQYDNIIILFLLGFSVSILQSFYYPALQSSIKIAIDEKNFAEFNSRKRVIESIVGILGPTIGVVCVTTIGNINAIFVNAISFIIAAAIFSKVDIIEEIPEIVKIKVSRLVGDSLVYLRKNTSILAGVLVCAGINLGLNIINGNLVFIIFEYYNLDPIYLGFVLSVGGIGAIVGSLLAAKIIKRIREGKVVIISTIVIGILMLAMMIDFKISILSIWMLINLFISCIIVAWMTYQQTYVDTIMLGRVSSVGRMFSYITIPIGAMIGSFILSKYSNINILYGISGIIVLASGIISKFTKLWYART